MSTTTPVCRTVTVVAFRGDRRKPFARKFTDAIMAGKSGSGSGPTPLECLMFAGHTGLSLDGKKTIYGFNPSGVKLAPWKVMDELMQGNRLPGVVTDDTNVFVEAASRGIPDFSFEVILPEPEFLQLEMDLDDERNNSQYWYGFPNGDGDCNCITWLERLGLPLLTGKMDEFAKFDAIRAYRNPRFGRCV